MGSQGSFQQLLPARFHAYARRISTLRSRYIWIELVNQVILGLLLLYLFIQRSRPYLTGWRLALALFILGCGVASGRRGGRRVEVHWTEVGGSMSMRSLWQGFWLLIPLFMLRTLLILLQRQGIADTSALLQVLPFFVPGMLTTRGISLLIKMRQMQKAFASQGEVRSPPVRGEKEEC